MNGNTPLMRFLKREVGPLTVMQVLMMLLVAAIGMVLLNLVGMASSMMGWLIIAVVAYILPHFGGADFRTKAVFGVLFVLLGTVVGGLLVGPAYVGSNSVEDPGDGDGDAFTDIRYHFGDGGAVTVTASFNTAEFGSKGTPYLLYSEITMVSFKSVYAPHDVRRQELTVSGNACTTTVTVDDSRLWYFNLAVQTSETNADGETTYDTVEHSLAVATINGDAYTGSMQVYVVGALICMTYIAVVYYLILVLATLMRRSISRKRAKMEDDGRLYPQGYGRCAECGAVVLPGEIQCRKCGAYIDRPEGMRRRKVDYFECSNCGAEVPADASVCPRCGSEFDGEVVNEVRHADGTVDVSSGFIECPGCGAEVPDKARLCPRCGHRF